jgi:hypothetical protein
MIGGFKPSRKNRLELISDGFFFFAFLDGFKSSRICFFFLFFVVHIISKFWWGHQHNTAKAAWMRWDSMEKPKCFGGMGFRDLEVFNLALLAGCGLV